ncbi:alpha/beta fold hydrolase [Salinarimonas sp. NSM]|uniref:alpha/beta fold hydrolase n=1 Tax=Salinarimonas sp. NSM TaxID=3458003 RepID=UPI004036C667
MAARFVATASAAALVLLAASAAADEPSARLDPQEVGIEQVRCTIGTPPDDPAACFLAWLPMSWDAVDEAGRLPEDAPRVGVHLTVLSNPTRDGEPNPVVVLAGGPGQAASDMIETWGPALELRRSRSVVLVDQRGTGRSVPSLACPDIPATLLDGNRFDNPGFASAGALVDELRACRAALVADGIALEAFDTRAAARDLAAIRRAFGFSRWNLVGTSYGAKLAQEAMRVDPDGIRAAVLNSPLPLAPDRDGALVAERPRLIEQLVADCAADGYCAETYGDLGERLRRIEARLAEAPLQAMFPDPQTRAPTRVEIAWPDVVSMIAGKMAFIPPSRTLPRSIAALDGLLRGRVALTDAQLAEIFGVGGPPPFDGMAAGLHLSVRCREDVPFFDESKMVEAVGDGFWFAGGVPNAVYAQICPVWDVPAVPEPAAPVESAIPTLVLTGDADPLTPTRWAREIAGTLPNAQLVSFRGQAHDLLASLACARVLAANFLDAPEAQVDAGCLEPIRPFFE